MMSLKRYDWAACFSEMAEFEDGRFVKYRDFEKLLDVIEEGFDCGCHEICETCNEPDTTSLCCKRQILKAIFGGEDE